MLILAIDTSGKNGSIALARAGDNSGDDSDIEVLETVPLTGGTFSAQLIPQISALLAGQEFDRFAIGAFAVASGPGSFTGLRVGLAAVQALAEITERPIAPVSLLEVCAFISGAQGTIMAALDAGRGDIYVGEYELPAKPGVTPREYLLSGNEFRSQSAGWQVVTPDSTIAASARAAGASVTTIPPISAAAVAQLGWRRFRMGKTVTPDKLEANYIRRTDAEMLEKIRS
ncbi:MAG TPA: tRNA (adenosine(37)-N6)-threonylcarbamoyltransferase complex dimerization subunit type 1 TsaB [Candidatus Sulfotelmatobacter sp.]|jgi:tRNA threonylcarbamoyladenosine biosynthesis protein TsaB